MSQSTANSSSSESAPRFPRRFCYGPPFRMVKTQICVSTRRRDRDFSTARLVASMKKRKVIRPIGPSIAYVPLTRNLHALIDAEDADVVGQFNWQAWPLKTSRNLFDRRPPEPTRYYAGTSFTVRKGRKRSLLLHELLGDEPNVGADHISANPLDNRKINFIRGSSPLEISDRDAVLPLSKVIPKRQCADA